MFRPLDGRVALVTGASRGLGRALALELARAGAHVIALARTQGALEELDDAIRAAGSEATLAPCDLTDFDALDRLGAAIFARWGRLDILIANAGVLGPMTPLAHIEPRQWEETLAVNLTANWRLIRSLDLPLRRAEAGRLIILTSGAGHAAQPKPYWGAYAITKAALEALARSYAAETMNISQIRVMAVDPGPMRTRLRAAAMPGEDPSILRTPEEAAPKIVTLCLPDWQETGKLYDIAADRVLSFLPPE